ncbi:MAG: hypothetical protein ACRCYU_16725 [Nocardioides sp.]
MEIFELAEIREAEKRAGRAKIAGVETAAELTLEKELILAASKQGTFLTRDDVQVLHLRDGQVIVDAAVPETVALQKIVVSTGSDSVSLEAAASHNQEATSILSPGPGFGSWGETADGQYVLKVYLDRLWPLSDQLIGTGTFLWQRQRFTSDGSSSYDWWKYSRKAIGQAEQVPGDNWQISEMRLQSYPYDSIQGRLKNWTDWSPSSDLSECSGGSSLSTSIGVPAFQVGYSFTPTNCQDYTVWLNYSVPGSFRLTLDQGAFVSEGTRSLAYTVGWKSVQGTPGSQHDYQRIVFVHTPTSFPGIGCSSYEVSGSCKGSG